MKSFNLNIILLIVGSSSSPFQDRLLWSFVSPHRMALAINVPIPIHLRVPIRRSLPILHSLPIHHPSRLRNPTELWVLEVLEHTSQTVWREQRGIRRDLLSWCKNLKWWNLNLTTLAIEWFKTNFSYFQLMTSRKSSEDYFFKIIPEPFIVNLLTG